MTDFTNELAISDLTLDELRPVLVDSLLNHVPFDGWTQAALARAAEDLGIPESRAELVFPGGAIDMVDAFIARLDDQMAAQLEALDLSAMKIRDRIRTIVRTRLDLSLPHREAIRRGISILGLPQNAVRATKILWRTADSMWYAAGDTATDYNYYTKRATLAGIYSSTLLVWLNDESDGLSETWGFLDRRIDSVMRFEKAKARVQKVSANRPSLSRFLGRLRYPAA